MSRGEIIGHCGVVTLRSGTEEETGPSGVGWGGGKARAASRAVEWIGEGEWGISGVLEGFVKP